MIAYQDFAPEKLASGGFFKQATYESLDACVAAANQWIATHRINVVNIETVVLPNMHNPYEEGTTDMQLHTSGDMASTWHQFIRVWHRPQTPPPL